MSKALLRFKTTELLANVSEKYKTTGFILFEVKHF